ncbi:MAG: PEP-CTERM sorting domain-containing protein [Planctomycetota bacterium]
MPIRYLRLLFLAWSLVAAWAPSGHALPVNLTPYGSLTATGLVDFNSLPSAPFPGVSTEGVVDLDGASFAEHFAGQAIGVSGDFDTVSGSPNDPLALVPGAVGENITVGNVGGIVAIAGLGPNAWPLASANGEGSLAILFDDDTAEFGLEILGVDPSTGGATFDFYRRNGTLIDSVTVPLPSNGFFGFVRELDTVDIAGVVITNDDVGGIAIDNVVFQLPIPEPGTWTLAALGVFAISCRNRKDT